MKVFANKYIESLVVCMLGLVIFGCLNLLMLQMNYDVWTNPKFGAYSAFHKGWELSGFDDTTYMAVAEWRPLYVMMRHPLIMYFVWPMYKLSAFLKMQLGVNCSIFVVAGVWTIVSTTAWMLLYKIMRRIMQLPVLVSLLFCLFFFSFSHVMLATFAPDHMILSMMFFLLTLYISAKATMRGRQMSTWKSLLLCFLATGVSTTNCVKIWLIDVLGMQGKVSPGKTSWWKRFIVHGMLYLLPLAAVAGLYYYQTQTVFVKENNYAETMSKKYTEAHPEKAAEKAAYVEKIQQANKAKQISDSKLFQWTDFSLPLMPSIIENFFGEGLQLHDEYTLRDSHRDGHRPDIVSYSHWYNYLVEAVIVVLLCLGIWCGRRQRLMWMAFAVFAFDCILHLGFRFALNDVYIMTPHWAFVIPIAVGYLYLRLKDHRLQRNVLLGVVACLTVWLWYHNLSLTTDFILNATRV